ncbi:Transposase IS66 family protein [Chitinophaga sancti]|uniref:Transposase IS66 family protein n=1 Tax=Chitinophaga sancti TaxID=1004 RepID=A0A1K1T2Y5_9BACT|nr:Transposase IS66 family protein [Chitinophaga sancti]
MLQSYALQEIAKLYGIEQACQKEPLNEEQIKDRRNNESLPILKALGDWMKKEYQQLRPKSLITQTLLIV